MPRKTGTAIADERQRKDVEKACHSVGSYAKRKGPSVIDFINGLLHRIEVLETAHAKRNEGRRS